MSLLSFIALAFGLTAATADGLPLQNVALIAVARASRASARRGVEQRAVTRTVFPAVRHARVRGDHRPLRRLLPPLRGTAAARAPGACC